MHTPSSAGGVYATQIKFNGAYVEQNKLRSITLSMDSYLHEIRRIQIDKARLESGQARATPREIAAFREVEGELVWLGGGTFSQASYVGSCMQQCVLYLEHPQRGGSIAG